MQPSGKSLWKNGKPGFPSARSNPGKKNTLLLYAAASPAACVVHGTVLFTAFIIRGVPPNVCAKLHILLML